MAASPDDALALWWYGELRLPEHELIAWARRQRLLPLLGWRAAQRGWQLPEALTEAIRRTRMLVAVGQTLVDQQLKALGETARTLGITVILVKGAAAAAAYPEPWMRPYGDIDLLVDEADAAGLLEALKGQGYTYAESTEGQRAWHFPALIPPHRGARIEVHTALAREGGRLLFTPSQWHDGLRPLDSTPGLCAPDPTDHVLYLIHHALIHHELLFGMQPYLDIGFWSAAWSSDAWDAFTTAARTAAMENAVALALALTAWIWQRPLPIAEAGFREPPPSLLSEAKETVAGTTVTESLPHVWRDIPPRAQGGLLRYAAVILLGDPAQLRELTPGERLRYHLRRPGELLRNHGASLWQLVRGDPATRAAWRAQRDLQAWLQEA
jgi:hypothetical protein